MCSSPELGLTDSRMDRQQIVVHTDRQADRQADRHMERYSYHKPELLDSVCIWKERMEMVRNNKK